MKLALSLTTGIMLSSRHHIHEWTMSSTRRLRTQVQASQDCEIILGWAFVLLQSVAATPYLVHHHILTSTCFKVFKYYT